MMQPAGMLKNRNGEMYPVPVPYSALLESGFSSTGAVATDCTIALGFKPTDPTVDVDHALVDVTSHYLLTIRKVDTVVTVWAQDVELPVYGGTVGSTYAEFVSNVLTEYCGNDKGYYSRLVIVESALECSAFWTASTAIPGLWGPGSLSGLSLHTLLHFDDAAHLGFDSLFTLGDEHINDIAAWTAGGTWGDDGVDAVSCVATAASDFIYKPVLTAGKRYYTEFDVAGMGAGEILYAFSAGAYGVGAFADGSHAGYMDSAGGLYALQALTTLTATVTNISVKECVGAHDWVLKDAVQSVDTPTNNYATMNPLSALSYPPLTDGNLTVGEYATSYTACSWFGMDAGKWYWETANNGNGDDMFGLSDIPDSNSNAFPGSFTESYAKQFDQNAYFRANGGIVASDGIHCLNGDVCGIAFDANLGAVWYHVNGVWDRGATTAEIEAGDTTHAIFTGLTPGKKFYPSLSTQGTSSETLDFGQNGYAYTPPEGFLPLCDANRPEPTILNANKYFHGAEFVAPTGANQTVEVGWDAENSDFLIMLKNLDSVERWRWINTVCGLDKALEPDDTAAEMTLTTAVTVSGAVITLPDDLLADGDEYIVYVIKAGAESGLDIQTYNGTGTTNAFDHDLGQVPGMFYVRRRDGTSNGASYWDKLGTAYRIDLSDSTGQATGLWGGIAPSSDQFTVGNYPNTNTSGGAYVAFLFGNTDVLRVFDYSGNGDADGPFIDIGGTPFAVLMCKAHNTTSNIYSISQVQNQYNPLGEYVVLDTNAAEATLLRWAIHSLGLKLLNGDTLENADAQTYVGIALVGQTKYRNAF